MHQLGFAHTDIKLTNVFVDSHGVAFIGDLEYLTGVNDPPRTDAPGTMIGVSQTARDQDQVQLERFIHAVNTRV